MLLDLYLVHLGGVLTHIGAHHQGLLQLILQAFLRVLFAEEALLQ